MRRFKISGLGDECTQLQTGSLYAIFSPVEKLSIQFALHCINESNDTYFILSDNIFDFFNSKLTSHPQITENYNRSTLFPFTFESLYISENKEEFIGQVLNELSFYKEIIKEYGIEADSDRFKKELVRKLINNMIIDLIKQIEINLNKIKPKNVNDIRNAGFNIASFSIKMKRNISEIRLFLNKRMYNHKTVSNKTKKYKKIIEKAIKQKRFRTYLNRFPFIKVM